MEDECYISWWSSTSKSIKKINNNKTCWGGDLGDKAEDLKFRLNGGARCHRIRDPDVIPVNHSATYYGVLCFTFASWKFTLNLNQFITTGALTQSWIWTRAEQDKQDVWSQILSCSFWRDVQKVGLSYWLELRKNGLQTQLWLGFHHSQTSPMHRNKQMSEVTYCHWSLEFHPRCEHNHPADTSHNDQQRNNSVIDWTRHEGEVVH